MHMKLESLTIALRHSFKDAGPDNPYQATLRISHDKSTMQVELGPETCRRILALAGAEISAAAQVQISDFVKTALAVSEHAMIEAETPV